MSSSGQHFEHESAKKITVVFNSRKFVKFASPPMGDRPKHNRISPPGSAGVLLASRLMPFGNSCVEPQRGSITQPRVGAQRLPWVTMKRISPTLKGLQRLRSIGLMQPRWSSVRSFLPPRVVAALQPWAELLNPFGVRVGSLIVWSSPANSGRHEFPFRFKV